MGHFHKKGQITVKTWRSIFNHVATRYLCISIDIYMPCDTYVLLKIINAICIITNNIKSIYHQNVRTVTCPNRDTVN